MPNEFIIAAYNLISSTPVEDTDLYGGNWRFEQFSLTINPNCLSLAEEKRQQLLNAYKNTFINFANETKTSDMLGNELHCKIQGLQSKTKSKLELLREIEKNHKPLYHTLKDLIHNHLAAFKNIPSFT